MCRAWGDLRKLIDLRMLERMLECKHKPGRPPFSTPTANLFVHCIAFDMVLLHRQGVLHRDLKASNVLLRDSGDYSQRPSSAIVPGYHMIADFECSVGVVGTGFWRAPEILQQLKDGVSMSKVAFTTEAGVYSFGMTCYEIVTGCTPFEGVLWKNYDHVLSGNQPILPVDLDPLVEKMIRSCWQLDPVNRPTFTELENEIKLFQGSLRKVRKRPPFPTTLQPQRGVMSLAP